MPSEPLFEASESGIQLRLSLGQEMLHTFLPKILSRCRRNVNIQLGIVHMVLNLSHHSQVLRIHFLASINILTKRTVFHAIGFFEKPIKLESFKKPVEHVVLRKGRRSWHRKSEHSQDPIQMISVIKGIT